ncbi:unnamed protein product [Ilex paraguariensis]|uniref:Uncharacterized protein n=1 Tax=Ilex paraguariensis TaxID=185542 RepID=A0ABC8UFL0_9AQUA
MKSSAEPSQWRARRVGLWKVPPVLADKVYSSEFAPRILSSQVKTDKNVTEMRERVCSGVDERRRELYGQQGWNALVSESGEEGGSNWE